MISDRKLEHLFLCKNNNVEYRKKTGFEDIELVHKALPEVNRGRNRHINKFLRKEIRFTIHNICNDWGTPSINTHKS